MPQVSILLPFYNASATLDRAVESIVNQTFSDWELLLIDNASTDDGPRLAEKWSRQDSRVKLASCKERGIAHALNHGLSLVNSAFIARMDADDWSHPSRLEKQVAFLHHYEEIGVLSCRTTFESVAEKSEGYEHFVNWQNSILSAEEHFVNRFKESPVAHPSVMFRSELAALHGDYSTAAVPEDYELWLRWMEAGVQFGKIPEQLLTWNDDTTRLSRTHPNYSEQAFFKVKGQYLAKWMTKHVSQDKIVVACGTSKECRQRAHWLMEQGVRVDYLTDVVPKAPEGFESLPYKKITSPEEFIVLNLIAKRGVSAQITKHFSELCFKLGNDLILLA
ncbi:MAG: glycosyltransferase family 2 protein [Cyclobacteriaceae bacterium]